MIQVQIQQLGENTPKQALPFIANRVVCGCGKIIHPNDAASGKCNLCHAPLPVGKKGARKKLN
jgi:hypothetical protein